MSEQIVASVLKGLDPDVLQYITSCVVEDGRIMEREDMLELVAPLLVSADFISDESKAEPIIDTLIEKLSASVSGKTERPEVVLLKNAVLMGGEKESDASAKSEALLDPMLKRRGGQAFGTNVVEEELDVHSKAAIAKARADAKAQAKRALLAEQAMREQLLMEAELEEARRAVARARLSGQAPGALGTIESEPFELPNPGGGENLLEDVRLRLVFRSPRLRPPRRFTLPRLCRRSRGIGTASSGATERARARSCATSARAASRGCRRSCPATTSRRSCRSPSSTSS